MHRLHIYPTSRSLRAAVLEHEKHNTLLPTLMRMDAFEQRSILVPNKLQVDALRRILLLRNAARFDAFKDLKVDLSLLRFFTKSDAIFKFFEELALEGVGFDVLRQADAYAEFGSHLDILQRLLANYQQSLDAAGLTDKAFIPSHYKLNLGFLKNYDQIDVHLEGYLNAFELELLHTISQHIPLVIHYTTSSFNTKMTKAFEGLGIVLPPNHHVSFSLSDHAILQQEANTSKINASVYAVEERIEQIALAFAQIEKMVQGGILPEEIVLIVPDESFKKQLRLYDDYNNLNFAMGSDYSDERTYKALDALYTYWQSFDASSCAVLERYGVQLEAVKKNNPNTQTNAEAFFAYIDALGLHEVSSVCEEQPGSRMYEAYVHFSKVFKEDVLSLKEWLFLWLKSLSVITIDDVRGGKVTVMGVLETRGVHFKGVVIVDFNEGIVPAVSSKDQFLNSSVRAFANLPTKTDREALQKQYYKRLLEQAKVAVVLYSTSDNKLPSKFLYELGLEYAQQASAQFDLLYAQDSQLQAEADPVVEHFDAHAITWSASRLKTFLDCKRKYYYRYIQKLQAKEEEMLNEGAFLHSLLEHVFRVKDRYLDTEQMSKEMTILLDTLLPFDDAKTTYQKLLWREKLKGFIQTQVTHFKADWKVIEREKEFQGSIGGLQFKGRIDRIDQNATHTLVLDYKSGNTTEAQKTKNIESMNDLQMSIYHQMLSDIYQNITLAFVKLFEHGEIEEITALEEKNARLAEVIIDLKQTKSFVAQKCEDLQQCKWCEFALMCERGEYL